MRIYTVFPCCDEEQRGENLAGKTFEAYSGAAQCAGVCMGVCAREEQAAVMNKTSHVNMKKM